MEDRIQHDQPDNAIPTLIERIDHLDSLIGREARHVKKLRDAALPAGTPAEQGQRPTPAETRREEKENTKE